MRISAVSYLNTKPFLEGLIHVPVPGVELSVDIPSECARKLVEGEVEIGLVPVAVIPQIKTPFVIPGFGIGADGNVDSVKLYSQVPIQEIRSIFLDYQSRTSIALARILAREKWNISPQWLNATPGYERLISHTTAGVVIGDRTFDMNGKFPFEFDLAGEWRQLTGLPFVFARWVANKKPGEEFLEKFASSMEYGLRHLDTVIANEKKNYPSCDVENYLTKSLIFRMDDRFEKGMCLFLDKLSVLSI
jgi:chorismate dehydratase